jgi:hypothetical protein
VYEGNCCVLDGCKLHGSNVLVLAILQARKLYL